MRQKHLLTSLLSLILTFGGALALGGCGSDDEPGTTDGGTTDAGTTDAGTTDGGTTDGGTDGIPGDVFAFGTEPGQLASAGPFPSDALLGTDGFVSIGKLADDPALTAATSKPELFEAYDSYIAERSGFGLTSPAWFFASEGLDMSTLEGRISMVGLSGPDAGRAIEIQAFWNETISALGVLPAFGDYLVGGTTYGIAVSTGVKTAAGTDVVAPEAFAGLLAGSGDQRVQGIFQPLIDAAGSDLVMGTVFTTNDVLAYGQALAAATDAFALVPPTREVRWDEDTLEAVMAPVVPPEELDTYFGVTEAPFEFNPGLWGGNRSNAEGLEGYEKRYEGGTLHERFGTVLNGSITVPVMNFVVEGGELKNTAISWKDGKPEVTTQARAPFTIFLCDDHVADPSNVPVAIFNHGGGALRSDALAFANVNCQHGIATAAIDMIFHGGRRKIRWSADADAIVPVVGDTHNEYTGTDVPDHVGDGAGAAASVGPMFAIGEDADPLIVEANLLAITTDTLALLRYLKEGDWSQVLDGLSFDTTRVYHQSLSFGTSFGTPVMALADFEGIVSSVGTGQVLMINMSMAPVNALTAAGIIFLTLGLPSGPDELQTGAYKDFMLGLHGWLHERGDPLPWAPHVLRHRADDDLPDVVSSGNSWDETLYNPTQFSYSNAIGLPAYTAGPEWTLDSTVPGSSRIVATEYPPTGISGNVTYNGQKTTAAIFYRDRSCHAQVVTALCAERFEHPYPPITTLETPIISDSPICQLHNQASAFIGSLEGGDDHALVVAPGGSCEDLYD
ncbi:MAG: hypothetical protein ACI9WU_000294 [Myxococcota bacterium]|jgi:hypothetical protein